MAENDAMTVSMNVLDDKTFDQRFRDEFDTSIQEQFGDFRTE